VKTILHGVLVRVIGLACVSGVLQTQSVCAQGSFDPIILQTGGSEALISAEQSLQTFSPANPPPIEFEFGFATDEEFAPSELFDSFTITLQDDAMNYTMVILTADASGIVWAPATPGALFLDPASIARAAIPFPPPVPGLASLTAYQASVPVPAQFQGQSAKLYLDLFDNLNQKASLAFFRLKLVPEPAAWMFFPIGWLGWLFAQRQRK
jgi:hypothetical protein